MKHESKTRAAEGLGLFLGLGAVYLVKGLFRTSLTSSSGPWPWFATVVVAVGVLGGLWIQLRRHTLRVYFWIAIVLALGFVLLTPWRSEGTLGVVAALFASSAALLYDPPTRSPDGSGRILGRLTDRH